VQIKGQWFSEFMNMYEAGRIELPTRRLRRTVLRLATMQEIPRNLDDRISWRRLLLREEYDLADPDAMERLVVAGRRNVEELEQIRAQLADFIRTHCALDDLLARQ